MLCSLGSGVGSFASAEAFVLYGTDWQISMGIFFSDPTTLWVDSESLPCFRIFSGGLIELGMSQERVESVTDRLNVWFQCGGLSEAENVG